MRGYAHNVIVTAPRALGKKEGSSKAVNSMHHQAVKRIAPALTATSMSEDGLIESFCAQDSKHFAGVQWHPESLASFDKTQAAIFSSLIKAARS